MTEPGLKIHRFFVWAMFLSDAEVVQLPTPSTQGIQVKRQDQKHSKNVKLEYLISLDQTSSLPGCRLYGSA
jgi:hypothetical protein